MMTQSTEMTCPGLLLLCFAQSMLSMLFYFVYCTTLGCTEGS